MLIGDVFPDGPAAKAGLKAGDIITKFDGQPTPDVNRLRNTVAATPPGQRVQVEVRRDGKQMDVSLTVGELEAAAPTTLRGPEAAENLGMRLETLTPEVAKQLGDEKLRGVLVSQVDPTGIAASAGMRPGDVIITVGSKTVASVADFNTALKAADLKKGIRLQVVTQGAKRFMFLKKK